MTYLDALQDTLAAEHAALYVLGVLGAQTSESAEPELFEALRVGYAEHRADRDALVDLVRAGGGEPVAAETAYALPEDLAMVAVVRARALEVETAIAAAYAVVVASGRGDQRRWPLQRLQSAAVRQLAYGAAPGDFPGSAEYAAR